TNLQARLASVLWILEHCKEPTLWAAPGENSESLNDRGKTRIFHRLIPGHIPRISSSLADLSNGCKPVFLALKDFKQALLRWGPRPFCHDSLGWERNDAIFMAV